MRIAIWNTYESLNTVLLTQRDAPIGDDLLLPFIRLKEEAERRGHTVEVLSPPFSRFDACVFFDVPNLASPFTIDAMQTIPNLYLAIMEPPTVKPNQWPRLEAPRWLHQLRRTFRRIFTWSDSLIREDPTLYVKLNYAQEFPDAQPSLDAPGGLVACVASNKDSAHVLSLYGKRRETLTWFAEHHPDALDLYGPGWNGHPLWKGTVARKREVLRDYRFTLCYENAHGLEGYITEKLFDCLIAGSVPIYWGASNVTDYVPPECFVDRRNFIDHETLFELLDTMPHEEWAAMRAAGERYMTSALAYPFTTRCFAETILDTLGAT